MPCQLAPTLGGDFAVPRIETHNDVTAKRRASVLQKTGVFDRRRSDDDIAQAGIQVALNGVKVTDAATKLNIHFASDLTQNLTNGHLIFRMASKGAVQVNQVQAPRALVNPTAGHCSRVFAKSGRLRHVALF